MALSRRTFLRYTALSTGSLVVADVFARPARAAVPSKVNMAFFLETKPTMIAKGEGWFEEGVKAKITWSGAEINTGMAAGSFDIGLAIGSSPTAAGIR